MQGTLRVTKKLIKILQIALFYVYMYVWYMSINSPFENNVIKKWRLRHVTFGPAQPTK